MKKAALYRQYDAKGKLLYVGVSQNLYNRIYQHENASKWFHEVASISVLWMDSKEEALAAEIKAITTENPAHNKEHACGRGNTKMSRAKKNRIDIVRAALASGNAPSIGRLSVLAGVSPKVIKSYIETINANGVEQNVGN